MMALAKRFGLPLFLLLGCLTAWVWAQRLGGTPEAEANARTSDSSDVPVLSVRRLPEAVLGVSQSARLDEVLGIGTNELSADSCAVILVDGVPIYELRPDTSLVPGYGQLLLTGHAALETLGSDYRFETRFLAEPDALVEGRVSGDVYLIGGGDPVLMTERYSQGFRPALGLRSSPESLADALVDAGVVEIDGAVVAVDERYDRQWLPAGVPPALVEAGLIAPTSALLIDDGWAERATSTSRSAVPAEDPSVFAAELLVQLLEQRSVRVGGVSYVYDPAEPLPELVRLAEISSPPLVDIVAQMFAVNDASAADMLVKELGFVVSEDGSAAAGTRAVASTLTEIVGDADRELRDGSGLGPSNSSTCRDLATVVDSLDESSPTVTVLPSVESPGVFGGRLGDLEVETDLRAIGGAAGNTSSLIGRTVGDEPQVTFASIVNRDGGPIAADLVFQRQVVEAIGVVASEVSPSELEVAGP